MSLIAFTPTKQLSLTRQSTPSLLSALTYGEFLAEGTFAAVWGYRNAAFKLTSDSATELLAGQLRRNPVPGLPRVFNVTHEVATDDYGSYCAVVSELLTPISARQFAPIRRAYQACKWQAELEYSNVVDQSVFLAELMAEKVRRLRTMVLSEEDPARLATALEWLAEFMDEFEVCADFGARRNWMVAADGRVVIADPVVEFIPRLDALSGAQP